MLEPSHCAVSAENTRWKFLEAGNIFNLKTYKERKLWKTKWQTLSGSIKKQWSSLEGAEKEPVGRLADFAKGEC